ncbi:MAG: hypothetical protein ACLFP8_08930 [Alphaproteobacteria bacterium]
MPTVLPQDSNDIPLPAMRLKTDRAHAVSVSTTSARNSAAFDTETRIVSLYATGPVYIKFGSSTVIATTSDHYFPEGFYYDVAIGGDSTAQNTHIATLAVDYDCMLYISEKH